MPQQAARVGLHFETPRDLKAVLVLLSRNDAAVEVRFWAVKRRAVSNRNGVAARRGGAHRNENDPSVTRPETQGRVNSMWSVWSNHGLRTH